MEALSHSSSEFIEKASGIKTMYLYDKHNCLDPNRMKPKTRPELPDNTSILAEMGIESAKKAIANAGITVDDIDGIILGTSHSARNYPAIAIEIQEALGINGYAYDMLVGCSSTTFAISNAFSDIASGLASTILVINPELTSPGNDFKIRDSHFIFGDACVATIVQGNLDNPKDAFQIRDRELVTKFSNNIRSDFSYMNRTDDLNRGDEVIIVSPYWVSYPEIIKLCGGKPKVLHSKRNEGFSIDIKKLEKLITSKTKWLILNLSLIHI